MNYPPPSTDRRRAARRRAARAISGLVMLGACLVTSAAAAQRAVPLPHEGAVSHNGPRDQFRGQHGAISPRDAGLPPAPVTLSVIAPTPKGPWTMRVDNVGEADVRIPADVRLLKLEVTHPSLGKAVKCVAPNLLRPNDFPGERALILRPGESYAEVFDPRLLCFGKDEAALVGGAVVRAELGWSDAPAWKRGDKAPYAAAGVDYPALYAPLKNLRAPAIRLSFGLPAAYGTPTGEGPGDQHSASDDPGIQSDNHQVSGENLVEDQNHRGAKNDRGEHRGHDHHGRGHHSAPDDNRPRLEVDTSRYDDASSALEVAVTVTAFNDGRRDMLAALRPRMVAFEVVGPLLEDARKPDPVTECTIREARYSTPREMFRTYKPNESVSFRLLVSELCPKRTFLRPGLYKVRPIFHATENGRALGLAAHTATARSLHEALVRVQSGRLPFHKFLPQAVPTERLTGERDHGPHVHAPTAQEPDGEDAAPPSSTTAASAPSKPAAPSKSSGSGW